MLFFAILFWHSRPYEKKHNISDHFALKAILPDERKVREVLSSLENQDIRTHFFLVRELAKKIDLGGWL
jgi:hypothetical protein